MSGGAGEGKEGRERTEGRREGRREGEWEGREGRGGERGA